MQNLQNVIIFESDDHTPLQVFLAEFSPDNLHISSTIIYRVVT